MEKILAHVTKESIKTKVTIISLTDRQTVRFALLPITQLAHAVSQKQKTHKFFFIFLCRHRITFSIHPTKHHTIDLRGLHPTNIFRKHASQPTNQPGTTYKPVSTSLHNGAVGLTFSCLPPNAPSYTTAHTVLCDTRNRSDVFTRDSTERNTQCYQLSLV